jgi:P27 family predicted phage terminase small subunit
VWQVTLSYQPYATTQTNDLAGSVTDARRAELAEPVRKVVAADSSIKTLHPLAETLEVETRIADATAAQTEANRLLALYKVAWGRLSVLLDRMGVLTEADSAALERLCDCYSDILICRQSLIADGWTYKTVDAQGNTLIKGNPAATQLRAADAQFKSYLIEFGLTPAARSKVHATKEEDKQADPLQEFFG